MRIPLVAGNWKMHGNRASNRALLDAVLAGIAGLEGVECAVCVPFPYLGEVAGRLADTKLAWGAQNLSEHAQGAHTGEVSAAMLKEFGCRYVIVGPSERRLLYGGSVKKDNAAALFAMRDIDGGLIGGASLVAADFIGIVQAAARAAQQKD